MSMLVGLKLEWLEFERVPFFFAETSTDLLMVVNNSTQSPKVTNIK
jgi:hypothetical protein